MFGKKSRNYNFTDRVREVLALARKEAVRLRHNYVGTEHLLLGLIREGGGMAAAVLRELSINPERVREQVEQSVRPGSGRVSLGDLPYTSAGKRVLELSMAEAGELHDSYVGTEHLLLALLREKNGIAAEVLRGLGATLEDARFQTKRLLREPGAARAPSPAPSPEESAFRLRIDDASDRSIYEQIVAQVQEAVATGNLRPGERLPTVRHLADELDVAPGTVARAYRELERLSTVTTDGARGTRVAERDGAAAPEGERPEMLTGLLRPVAVAAFHLGATAAELRSALDAAMRDIFGGSEMAA